MMQRRDFMSGGALAVLVLAGTSLTTSQANAASGSVVTTRALGQINAYRKSKGRRALINDPALGRAALEHSSAMAKSGKLNHNRFRARLRRNGISGAAAENVALGPSNVASVIASWDNSRGHRRNMLGNYSRVGLAVARNPASRNRPYWTMILAR